MKPLITRELLAGVRRRDQRSIVKLHEICERVLKQKRGTRRLLSRYDVLAAIFQPGELAAEVERFICHGSSRSPSRVWRHLKKLASRHATLGTRPIGFPARWSDGSEGASLRHLHIGGSLSRRLRRSQRVEILTQVSLEDHPTRLDSDDQRLADAITRFIEDGKSVVEGVNASLQRMEEKLMSHELVQ